MALLRAPERTVSLSLSARQASDILSSQVCSAGDTALQSWHRRPGSSDGDSVLFFTGRRYRTLLAERGNHQSIPIFSPVLLSGVRSKLVSAFSARTLILVGFLPLSCHGCSHSDCVPVSRAQRVRRLVLLLHTSATQLPVRVAPWPARPRRGVTPGM